MRRSAGRQYGNNASCTVSLRIIPMDKLQKILIFIVENETLLLSSIVTITALSLSVIVAFRTVWQALRNIADAVEVVNPSKHNPVKIASRELKGDNKKPLLNLAFKILTKKYTKGE